ncbi:MAG: hypothetical protein A2Y17_07905 [Clostridiales bacterium GWF2_38_85]|nr:MAG: hypothetical protein A2Y17_07905 [Clostridiales bacterium GWF2_38_85]HBL84200.1 hypothetical protein [Clostridiales bacterium]
MKKIASLFLVLMLMIVLSASAIAVDDPPVIHVSKIDNALAFESDCLIMTPAFGDNILKAVKTITKEDETEAQIGTISHSFKWWAVAVCEWDDTEGAYVVTQLKGVDGIEASYDIPDNGFVVAIHITDQTNDSTAFAQSNVDGKNALAVGAKLYLYNINIANATIDTTGVFASLFEEAGIDAGVESGSAVADKDGEPYAGELVFDNFVTNSFIAVGTSSNDTSLTAYDPTAVVEESEADESEASTEEPPITGDSIVIFAIIAVISLAGAAVISKARR